MGINWKTSAWLLLAALFWNACYTFKGISINPDVHTFYVSPFETAAPNAPPNMAFDFGERLKDKIRTETRLTLNEEKPDVEFSGKITEFRIVPVAPKPGEEIALNKLEVTVSVGMINNVDDKATWTSDRRFSFFKEFANDVDFLSVQDELIRQINDQLLEDIFNAAFNNW